jgi:hypothetical protein
MAQALPVTVSAPRESSNPGWRLAPFCAAALVLSVLAPLWLLLLSPLLFGVPHLVSDLRYLVLAPRRASRAWATPILLPLAVLTGLRLAVVLGSASDPGLEAALGITAIAGAVAIVDAPRRRRLVGGLLLCGLAALALGWPTRCALLLGHLHNAVGLGLWLAWARATRRTVAAVVLGVGACSAAFAVGAFDAVASAADAFHAPSSGLSFGALVETLAPGLGGVIGARVVLVYAFAQALHYAVWLVLIPSVAHRPRERWSIASLREDLGPVGLVVAASLCLAVPVAGVLAPVATRDVYLSLVLFHGWLEIAVIARWLVARERAPWAS